MDNQIFLSHSRRDRNLRAFFLSVFGVSSIQAKAVEFEEMEYPPWSFIKEEIAKSKAVFLLLGENVIDKGIFTQNWISFEIGLACQMGKDVWVFEEKGTETTFPVPYLNYYYQFAQDDGPYFRKIREILEEYSKTDDKPFFESAGFTCPHDNCRIKFNYILPTIPGKFPCPACRQEIKIL